MDRILLDLIRALMQVRRMTLIGIIQKIRPAPLQVILLQMLRLNRRREAKFRQFCFFVDPSSYFGSRIVDSGYESYMVATLERYLKPGGAFLDIGANEGFFSVLACDLVGSKGRVIAVEPQERLIPILRKNLELNGCTVCAVEQGVVGDVSGEKTLHLAPVTNTGSTSLYPIARYAVPTQTVKSWTLEELLTRNGIETVDLVKIDAEGAEYDILMSAEAVLSSGRLRAIALEYHPAILARYGLSMEDIHDQLISSGYSRKDDGGKNAIYEFEAVP